jgi:(1->4)-alpha-D-glucan 1-alpha-D-glucosylmutase
MVKAAREAKQHTNWAFPNAGYEAALIAVVRGLLGRLDGNPVLADLQARAQGIAWFGALNSLATTVLKFSSPGVPDIYQGCELLELSLVDPDNRRPVDFERRDRLLAELEAQRVGLELHSALASLARTPEDGRAKLWLAWRLLAHRQAAPALFSQGRYVALPVRGGRRRHAIAFARRMPGATLLVMVGRKFAGLGLPAGTLPLGEAVWGDTHVRRPDWLAPPPLRGFDVLTEREVEIGPGPLPLAEHFVHFPATALWLQT